MFASLLKSEHTRLFKRALVWIEFGIMVALILALFGTLSALVISGTIPEADAAEVETLLTWPGALVAVVSFASGQGLGGLMIIVLVGVVVAQDYTHQTFSLWLRQGASRPAVIVTKLITLFGAMMALTMVTLLAGGLLSIIYNLMMGYPVSLAAVNWGQVLMTIVRTAYTLLPYLALTFVVATLTRSVAGSIGITVGYSLLIEGLIAQILMLVGGNAAKVIPYLPGFMAQAIGNLNVSMVTVETEGGMATATGLLEPNVAAVGIAIYTAIFIGLAIWRFQKQDLTV